MTRFTLLTGIAGETLGRGRAQGRREARRAARGRRHRARAGEVTDLYYDWARLREVDEDGALLVRPDKHIGWRSPAAAGRPGGALLAALSAILSRED